MHQHLAKMSNKAAEEGLTEDDIARPKFDRYFGDAGRLRSTERAWLLTHPFTHRLIHSGLPATPTGFERGQHVRIKADRCRHFEGFVFGTSHALRAQRGVHLGCEKFGCGQGTRKVLLRPLRVV